MYEHPQRYIPPIVLPAGVDDSGRFVLDVLENGNVNFPEITETLDSIGGAEGQEVQIGDGLEVPFHIRYDHVTEGTRIVTMKDLVCLLLPPDDLIDPFGSRRWEGGNERLHNTFVDFRCLFEEKVVLFRILKMAISVDMSRGTSEYRPCECEVQSQER